MSNNPKPDRLIHLAPKCAQRIRENPKTFHPAVGWLTGFELKGCDFGEIPERLVEGFRLILPKFNKQSSEHLQGLYLDPEVARRLVLLTALAFDEDFDGSELDFDTDQGRGWPWGCDDDGLDQSNTRRWAGVMLESQGGRVEPNLDELARAAELALKKLTAEGEKPVTGKAQSAENEINDGEHEGQPGMSNRVSLDDLPDRVRTAAERYQRACEAIDDDEPKDREVFDLLQATNRAAIEQGKPPPYPEIDRFDTWQRYIREWRKATGQQKHKSRSARLGDDHGSIVNPEDI